MMKRILIWRDKHYDYYYDASTPELLEKSSVLILKELINRGYIFDPGEIELSEDERDTIAFVESDAFEDAPNAIRQDYRGRMNRIMDRQKFQAEDKAEFDTVDNLVHGKTCDMTAWQILQNRSGAEYEIYELEELISPQD